MVNSNLCQITVRLEWLSTIIIIMTEVSRECRPMRRCSLMSSGWASWWVSGGVGHWWNPWEGRRGPDRDRALFVLRRPCPGGLKRSRTVRGPAFLRVRSVLSTAHWSQLILSPDHSSQNTCVDTHAHVPLVHTRLTLSNIISFSTVTRKTTLSVVFLPCEWV